MASKHKNASLILDLSDNEWIDKNHLRRSKRIAEKVNLVDDESSDSFIVDDDIDIDFSDDNKRSHSDEEFVPNKKQRVIEDDDTLISLSEDSEHEKKKTQNSYEKKIKKLDNDKLYDLKLSLEDEEWYCLLSKTDKTKYAKKIIELQEPIQQLSTIKDILDLPINKQHIKDLISERTELDFMNKLSPLYETATKKFVQKINYYTDKNNIEKLSKINNFIDVESNNKDMFNPIIYRIAESSFDEKTKSLLYMKYIRYCNNDEESVKYQNWLNTVLSIPNKKTMINTTKNTSEIIKNMLTMLNEKIYGMEEVKEELLCMIANMINNPVSKYKAIGLCGPPGIGKTMLANIIADVLKLPIGQIALGGAHDSSFLEGHSFTYFGAEPGKIVKTIINMGSNNGIIYFDEIDKISKNDKGNEVEHSLLHITDFTQNHDFRDKYMPEIPIDLSNYIFIYSMNSTHNMDPVLLSRIPMIHFSGYTPEQKIVITKNHILPDILKNYNLNDEDVTIDDTTLCYLISKIKEENAENNKSGVRSLKFILNKIISRINLYRYISVDGKVDVELTFKINNFKFPFEITRDLVDQIVCTVETDKVYLSFYS